MYSRPSLLPRRSARSSRVHALHSETRSSRRRSSHVTSRTEHYLTAPSARRPASVILTRATSILVRVFIGKPSLKILPSEDANEKPYGDRKPNISTDTRYISGDVRFAVPRLKGTKKAEPMSEECKEHAA